jgi:hypothetical protein
MGSAALYYHLTYYIYGYIPAYYFRSPGSFAKQGGWREIFEPRRNMPASNRLKRSVTPHDAKFSEEVDCNLSLA